MVTVPAYAITALIFALALQSPGSASQAPPAVPRFEPAACPVEVAAGERIDCGALIVPENRRVAGSRAIRLPVMILRARSAAPMPDPVVFLTGGPGNSGVARLRSGKNIPWLDERDHIVLEQRGARLAQPHLDCPEVNRIKGEIAAGRLHGAEAEAVLISSARNCAQGLRQSGIDLDGYTSEASADDLEDLRRLLGIRQWNVFGLSYGTRLALTLMRKHPSGVRSAILDSVLPPEVNFDEVSAQNLHRALNLVFDGCAVDRECGAAYPNLRRLFADLVSAADRDPLPLPITRAEASEKPVRVRGAQVVDAVYSALHNPQTIPVIPRVIASAAAGQYGELTALVKGNQGPSGFSYGLRYSVWCAEEMPFQDPARVLSQASPELGLGGIDEGTATPAVCRAWNVAPSPASENTPVTSDVPTLVFAGEFDPDTPPQWGRQLLDRLSRASYVEMRGQSHGASFNRCGAQIASTFLRDPTSPPAVGCALALRGADFSLSTRKPGSEH